MNDSALGVGLKARPDSSAGRALDVQSQGPWVRASLASVIFPHSLLIKTCISQKAYLAKPPRANELAVFHFLQHLLKRD